MDLRVVLYRAVFSHQLIMQIPQAGDVRQQQQRQDTAIFHRDSIEIQQRTRVTAETLLHCCRVPNIEHHQR